MRLLRLCGGQEDIAPHGAYVERSTLEKTSPLPTVELAPDLAEHLVTYYSYYTQNTGNIV